jgi:DNA-binding HxlR family transcriptional regulator
MNQKTRKAVTHTPLGCIEAATRVLGDKWSPLIIGELAKSGTLRFCAIQDKAGGVNPRTLSARLDELEVAGIVHKESFHEVPPRCEYSLTKKGQDLVPALRAMADWSKKYA